MDPKIFDYAQYDQTYYALLKEARKYKALLFKGPDTRRFLNGQLTSDISTLQSGSFQESSRLDRSGRVKSFFILCCLDDDNFITIGKSELIESLSVDLEKYIIMDDVEIHTHDKEYQINFSLQQNLIKAEKNIFFGKWAGMPAYISQINANKGLRQIDETTYRKMVVLRAIPELGVNVEIDQLVTDTVLNLNAVSHQKGCYLGQETVSKIETRRGGAHFPIVIEVSKDIDLPEVGEAIHSNGEKVGKLLERVTLDNKSYILISAVRKFRVDKMNIKINSEVGVVHYLPVGGEYNEKSWVEYLYQSAVELFHESGAETALPKFKEILNIIPNHEDTLETIGVIYGQLGEYEKGIELMEEVLDANPDSIMAHTNKSLFYMKMGKIEEAEEEKAQATVKSFSNFGKEAEAKRVREEQEEAERKDIERREQMFKQVLEIDPEDTLANFGMADIHFKRNELTLSENCLKKVLSEDEKYSVAYVLLGKVYQKLGQKDQAIATFTKGIEVASNKGDLMPANEMQQLLNQLN